jgi:MobA/MobL family protein
MSRISFKTAPISRRKGGNAVRSAAYRSGTALQSYVTYEVYDRWSRRTDVVHSEILLPPGFSMSALMERGMLWSRVEWSERRKDAQLARDWLFPLHPHMPIENNIELIRRYLQERLVSRGMIADLNIHNPGPDARNGPLHAHVMTTLRCMDFNGTFREKRLDWRGPGFLRDEHKAWANFVRKFMAENIA